jgi:hypothetical protein
MADSLFFPIWITILRIQTIRCEATPMNKIFRQTILVVFIAFILNVETALAHDSITVGDYEIEVGWANEPPVAGLPNAIEIRVSNTSSDEPQPVEDVSSLTLTVSYGGQTRILTLEQTGEHGSGHFEAAIVPTIPGQYTLHFRGTLGDNAVDAEVEPEEVLPEDTLAFPAIDSDRPQTGSLGMTEWWAIAGFVSGLAALILSFYNLSKSR